MNTSKDVFLRNPCLVKLKWKDEKIIFTKYFIRSYLNAILSTYSLKIDHVNKVVYVECKDISSVDTFVKELSNKKSFFTVFSYKDLLKNVNTERMNKKSLLHLLKRNNEELQNINDKTLDRIINKTKKVK